MAPNYARVVRSRQGTTIRRVYGNATQLHLCYTTMLHKISNPSFQKWHYRTWTRVSAVAQCSAHTSPGAGSAIMANRQLRATSLSELYPSTDGPKHLQAFLMRDYSAMRLVDSPASVRLREPWYALVCIDSPCCTPSIHSSIDGG